MVFLSMSNYHSLGYLKALREWALCRTASVFLLVGLAGAETLGCGTTGDDSQTLEGPDSDSRMTDPVDGDAGTATSTGIPGTEVETDSDAALLASLISACASDGGVSETGPVALRGNGFRIGAALKASLLELPEYAEVAAREFNYVTAVNDMKWERTEPEPGVFSFGPADQVVAFASENDMLVKGHTLVWHNQLPDWMSELQGESAVRDALTQHIEMVVSHFRDEYPGRVVAWDVVNEALASQGDTVTHRDAVFYRELGEGYVAEAFHLARQVDPDVQLIYNDYGIEDMGPKSNATFEWIRDMLNAGVPVDGVGFQMHTTVIPGPQGEEFAQNIARYTELGLTVNISEMDVSLCQGYETREEALLAQRVRYNDLVSACVQNPRCDAVTFWGFSDAYTWLDRYGPCDRDDFKPWPLVFSENYSRKPAWWGVYDALTGCIQEAS